MATTSTSKVVMSFLDEDEKAMSVTLNNAKSDVTAAQVKTFMDTMIAKADCFIRAPYKKTGAKIVTTESTDLDINN